MNENIILDLNGYSISGLDFKMDSSRKNSLTVKNGTINGKITYWGSLTLENVTIKQLAGQAESITNIKGISVLNGDTCGNIVVEKGAMLIIDSNDFRFIYHDSNENGHLCTNNGTILINDINSQFTVDEKNTIVNNGKIMNNGVITNVIDPTGTTYTVNIFTYLMAGMVEGGTIDGESMKKIKFDFLPGGDFELSIESLIEDCELAYENLDVVGWYLADDYAGEKCRSISNNEFILNAENNKEMMLYAKWGKAYPVKIEECKNGVATLNTTIAEQGETVTINTIPSAGCTITNIYIKYGEKDKEKITNSFTMSNNSAKIYVEFQKPSIIKDIFSGLIIKMDDKVLPETYKLNVGTVEISKDLSDKNVKLLYNIDMMNGENKIEIKDTKMEMKIPISAELAKFDNYKIAYIKDGKINEEYDAKLLNDDEKLYVIKGLISHLSQYAVIAYNDEKPEEKVQAEKEEVVKDETPKQAMPIQKQKL